MKENFHFLLVLAISWMVVISPSASLAPSRFTMAWELYVIRFGCLYVRVYMTFVFGVDVRNSLLVLSF